MSEPADEAPAPSRHRRYPETAAMAHGMAETAALAGVSRSYLYAEAAAGRLVTRKAGRRRIVLAADLTNWLERLPTG